MSTFRIEIPQPKIDDLHRRLDRVNWPADFENEDWEFGVPTAYLRELVEYWRDGFDWRAQEAAMNEWRHQRVDVDGLPIHFIHERGKGPNPVPLILTHGWPWTFWDLKDLIGPLTNPAKYGGDAQDGFDVVIPSLPGFIFSTPIARRGVHWMSTASLWSRLMREELGYARYAAQGGDWGAMVTTQLGHQFAEELIGIHCTNAFPVPAFGTGRPWAITEAFGGEGMTREEEEKLFSYQKRFAAHIATHMLHPQTFAVAMHDSPAGLLAWMLEKRMSWGDCRGDVESRFNRDHLLTTISLYWLTDSFVSSARYYAEAARTGWTPSRVGMPQVPVPTCLSLFEHDLPPGSLDWTKEYFDLRKLEVRSDGGHFGPAENPQAIIDDLRAFFRPLRDRC